MAASGRDIAVFVGGLCLAGLTPIFLMPELELLPLLAVFSDVTGGIPLEHAGLVAFLALLAAAWVDTERSPQPTVEQWDQ